MKTRNMFCLFVAGVLMLGCFIVPTRAIQVSDSYTEIMIARATGRIEESIPGKSTLILAEVSLASNEIVTYRCSYTPRSASVDFGFIAPDGYFYGLNSTTGSMSKGIRVSEPGIYTLAIYNNSNETATVTGTVNY